MGQPLCWGMLVGHGSDQLHRRPSYRMFPFDHKHFHRQVTICSHCDHITSPSSAVSDRCGSRGSGSAAEHVTVERQPAWATMMVDQQSVLEAFNSYASSGLNRA